MFSEHLFNVTKYALCVLNLMLRKKDYAQLNNEYPLPIVFVVVSFLDQSCGYVCLLKIYGKIKIIFVLIYFC